MLQIRTTIKRQYRQTDVTTKPTLQAFHPARALRLRAGQLFCNAQTFDKESDFSSYRGSKRTLKPGTSIKHSVLSTKLTTGSPRSFTSMSWMDSWSRPSANSKIPAPLYLSNQDIPYCQTCGRIMNSKKVAKPKTNSQQTQQQQEIKYCSTKCRSRKPGARDRSIERKIAALLDGEAESGIEGTGAKDRVVKGDRRMVVTCDEIEAVCFGSRFDPEKVFGRRKNRRTRALDYKQGKNEWRSVDMESSGSSDDDSDSNEGGVDVSADEVLQQAKQSSAFNPGDSVPFSVSHIRPSQMESEINFNAGGGERSRAEKIEESPEDLARRLDGAKRAEEREIVRRAARRVVVFGVQSKTAKDGGNPDIDADESRGAAKKSHKKGKKSLDQAADEDGVADGSNAHTRKAEALMNGVVVEPSFAKGNWSIRWRE